MKRITNRPLNTQRLKTPVVGTAKIHWLIDLIQLSYVNISMNNSAEENNPEVFPGNKTGGIHCRKSLILPKKQTNKQTKKHNITQLKTKQNKNLQSQKIRSSFEAGGSGVCFQLQTEESFKQRSRVERFGSQPQTLKTCRRKFDAHWILSSFIFTDYLLKVSSIMRCWMVNTNLDLSVTF